MFKTPWLTWTVAATQVLLQLTCSDANKLAVNGDCPAEMCNSQNRLARAGLDDITLWPFL